VIPKPRKLGNILFSVRPRALQSRSYATKIKSARASAVEAEKSKENKAVNLLTDEQTDLLSLSSPSKISKIILQIKLMALDNRKIVLYYFKYYSIFLKLIQSFTN
jgi:hypothetical protein